MLIFLYLFIAAVSSVSYLVFQFCLFSLYTDIILILKNGSTLMCVFFFFSLVFLQ